MIDKQDSLILEHLKCLEFDLKQLHLDFRYIKFKTEQLERFAISFERTLIYHSERFDRIDDRLRRIEEKIASAVPNEYDLSDD